MSSLESQMINLTRLNHIRFVVNSDLIEQIERTPDTVITLTTGQKLMVRESTEEIIDLVVQFRRSLLGDFAKRVVEHQETKPPSQVYPA